MQVKELFDQCLAEEKEFPVLSSADFERLKSEVWASNDLSELEKQDVSHHYLYRGRGFGVDSNLMGSNING